MSAFKKIAITVPAETYRALEKARDRLGKSRSEVISTAIRDWLHGLEAGAARQKYVMGYLRHPETDDPDLIASATADWSAWEPGAPSRAAEPRGRKR
jgi:hypothetical protein